VPAILGIQETPLLVAMGAVSPQLPSTIQANVMAPDLTGRSSLTALSPREIIHGDLASGLVEGERVIVVTEGRETPGIVIEGEVQAVTSGEATMGTSVETAPDPDSMAHANEPGFDFDPWLWAWTPVGSDTPPNVAGNTDIPPAPPLTDETVGDPGQVAPTELPTGGCETIEAWEIDPYTGDFGPVVYHWNGFDFEAIA